MALPPDHAARLERALTALDGLATGDAFGERFFVNPAQVEGLIAARAVPAAPWPYTDDTIMALSLVEVLARHGRVDQEALADAFAARYEEDPARGYGPGAHGILGEILRGEPWSSAAYGAFRGQGSLGNGGAMRVAPLGAYFADDLEALVVEAARSAEVTHAHPDGQAGAVAVALAAAFAWRDRDGWTQDPQGFLREVAEATPQGATQAALLDAADLSPDHSAKSAAAYLGNGAEVTAMDTVPFCLWVVAHLGHLPWEDALWHTVSALGDRDTTCAIVGGVLAVAQGPAAIPASWRFAREALPDLDA
ncbi:MAG: ADP-ribosylglycohydrolase family protein [Planctomycetota bacterium]